MKLQCSQNMGSNIVVQPCWQQWCTHIGCHDCWHNKNRFELQGLQWTLIQVNIQSQPVHCLCHGDTALNYIWGLLGQSSLCRSLCSWEQRPFFQGGYVYKDLKEIQKWHYNLTTDCNSHPNCMVHVRYI